MIIALMPYGYQLQTMTVPQNLMINVRAIIFQVQVIFIFMQVIVFKTLLAGQQIYPRWASAHYPHNLIYASIQDEPEKNQNQNQNQNSIQFRSKLDQLDSLSSLQRVISLVL